MKEKLFARVTSASEIGVNNPHSDRRNLLIYYLNILRLVDDYSYNDYTMLLYI
jgi:hypothetical protein